LVKLAVAATLSGWGMVALAGTCQDPGKHLTNQERRNVKTACEQAAATEAGWKSAADGARRLKEIETDDFHFFTPTTDVDRFLVGTRDDYIKLVTVTQREEFSGGKFNVIATTAQGDRVAMEAESVVTEHGGSVLRRKYHLLLIFNAQGKIETYKMYQDTAGLVAEKKAKNEEIVRRFLAGMTASPSPDLPDLLTDTVKWGSMDRAAVIKTLHGLPSAFRELHVTPKRDGFITQDDRVAVSAVSSGTWSSGEPYRNAYEFLFVMKDGKIDSIRAYAVAPEAPRSVASKASQPAPQR
jgi:ketosteroid isomerase-like protein